MLQQGCHGSILFALFHEEDRCKGLDSRHVLGDGLPPRKTLDPDDTRKGVSPLFV
jgi:hypothetical protein